MCVCVSLCMYVCMFACMYACIYVFWLNFPDKQYLFGTSGISDFGL